ncbi:MAG: amidohydrolase family protein [Actinomycetota bacterium]
MDELVIIRGGHVLTMGPLGDLVDGAVACAAGQIVAVGPFVEVLAAHPDAEVVGDEHGIVLPGFVNAHTHLSEALIPGMGERWALPEWIERIIVPVGRVLDGEAARVGTRLKAAEMLLSGVTTVNDMWAYSAVQHRASLGVVDGLESMGLRGIACFGATDLEGGEALPADGRAELLAEQIDLADRCGGSELVDMRLGVGVVHGQSDELLADSVALAEDRGWSVHTHLAEVREELTLSRIRWGGTTTARAAAAGLLSRPLIAGHGVWLTEPDIELLLANGSAIVHNPVANMILGSGTCPVVRLRRAGLPMAIGTDGAASNDSQNMFEAIKLTALLQKLDALDPSVFEARDALTMATIEGAAALGMDDRVGSLEVGKRADVQRLDGHGIGLASVHDPYQQIVYCCGPGDVADVWVDGVRRVADGRLCDMAVAELVEESKAHAQRIVRDAKLTELSALA